LGKELDNQEKSILKELVKDPRISDNQIALKTGIPVKSVNRKRKNLESERILSYHTRIDNNTEGTGIFGARRMYTILFDYGISRQMLLNKFPEFGFESVVVEEV